MAISEVLMVRRYSVADARHNLAALIHQAERGATVEVTRRGHIVAVLVSASRWTRLERSRPTFWRALQEFRRTTDLSGRTADDWRPEDARDGSPGRDVDL